MPTDPTWDDTVEVGSAPSWEDTSPIGEEPKDFRRDELAKQMFQARLEGEQGKLYEGLADVGTELSKGVVRAASHVDPTGFTQGLMQQYGVEPTRVIAPEAILPDVETVSKFAGEGLRNLGIDPNTIIPQKAQGPLQEFAAENIAALPEMAPLMAAGVVEPQAVGRLFQAQMLQGVPQAAYQAATAETPEERLKAGLGAAAGLAFPAAIEMGLRPKAQVIPDFTGRALERPQGAIPPRVEPAAPIERVTPEQSALAAERMSAPFEEKLPTEPTVLAPEKTEVVETVVPEVKPPETPPEKSEVEQIVETAATPIEVAKVAEENNAPNVAKAEAEIVPMGGDVLGANAPTTPMQSAIKNAAVDRDRVERGEPPMMDALRKGDPELWSQAMNVVDQDWTAADKLIARHKSNPFIPTDVETMILLHRRVDLKNEFNKANREAVLAEQEGRGDAAEAAKAVRDSMGEKLLELEQVMGKGDTAMGTMAGRAFRARQLVMNEDFTMAELVPNREAALGRKLTDPERAQLQAISDANAKANAELQARVEKLQAERDSIDAKRIIAESEARIKRELPYHPRILELAEGYAKKWDERGAKALADLKALFGSDKPMFSGAPISPEMLDKAIIYGASKIVRGTVDFAKWSDSMIRDLGAGFEKYAKEVFDASKKAFDSDVAVAFKKQGAATVQKVKGALKADLGTQTILKKIQRKVEESKGVLPDLKYYFDQLLDFHVRRGLKEEGPLLDAIYADAQKVIPDITKRETREILAGYGAPLKPLAKDVVSVIKRDMHGQWQEISKIDMIKRGIFPPKLQERATMTDKQRWLRKQYEAEKRLHPEVVPSDVEGQLKTAMQAAKTRITNQITDLEQQIKTRTKIVKESKKLKPDAELERLTAIRDEMRAVYDTVFKKPELTDAERLEIWKERTRDRIEELTEKVKNKEFQPRKRPDPIRLDPQAIKLNFELHKVHRALLDLRLKDQLDKRSTTQKVLGAVANLIRFSRAVITGGEFSAVLRQGAFTAGSHPIISAKALAPMFKALMSEEAQFKVMEQIMTRENAPLYQRSKLELTETGMRLSNMEEHYMFRVSEKMRKIPGFGQLIKGTEAFQRAYTTFLNVIRADTFDALAETYGKDAKTTKDIANLINVATGRGSVSLGKYAQGLNTVLFAPRYSISRFQLLLGQPLWTAANKQMIIKEYAKAFAGAATVYSLGTMAGGTVELDPRSSDFGKIKIGNTRIDPLAGLAQAAVVMSRFASGQKKTSKGKIQPLVGKKEFGKPDIQALLSDFGMNKLAPLPSTLIKLRQGHDQIGQPYGLKNLLVDTATPITYRDIYDTMKQQDIPEATIMSVLAIFGMGVQNYEDQRTKKTAKY